MEPISAESVRSSCQALSLSSIQQLRTWAQQLNISDANIMSKYDLCRLLSERLQIALDPVTIRGVHIEEYETMRMPAASIPPSTTTTRSIATTTGDTITDADALMALLVPPSGPERRQALIAQIRFLNEQISFLNDMAEWIENTQVASSMGQPRSDLLRQEWQQLGQRGIAIMNQMTDTVQRISDAFQPIAHYTEQQKYILLTYMNILLQREIPFTYIMRYLAIYQEHLELEAPGKSTALSERIRQYLLQQSATMRREIILLRNRLVQELSRLSGTSTTFTGTTTVIEEWLRQHPDLVDPISHRVMQQPIRLPLLAASSALTPVAATTTMPTAQQQQPSSSTTILYRTYDLEPLRQFLQSASGQARLIDPLTRLPIASHHVYADLEKWQQVSQLYRQLGLVHPEPNAQGYDLIDPSSSVQLDIARARELIREEIEELEEGDTDRIDDLLEEQRLTLDAYITEFPGVLRAYIRLQSSSDPQDVILLQQFRDAIYQAFGTRVWDLITSSAVDPILQPIVDQEQTRVDEMMPVVRITEAGIVADRQGARFQTAIQQLRQQWNLTPNIFSDDLLANAIVDRVGVLLLIRIFAPVIEALKRGEYDLFLRQNIPLGTASLSNLIAHLDAQRINTIHSLSGALDYARQIKEGNHTMHVLRNVFESRWYDLWTEHLKTGVYDAQFLQYLKEDIHPWEVSSVKVVLSLPNAKGPIVIYTGLRDVYRTRVLEIITQVIPRDRFGNVEENVLSVDVIYKPLERLISNLYFAYQQQRQMLTAPVPTTPSIAENTTSRRSSLASQALSPRQQMDRLRRHRRSTPTISLIASRASRYLSVDPRVAEQVTRQVMQQRGVSDVSTLTQSQRLRLEYLVRQRLLSL